MDKWHKVQIISQIAYIHDDDPTLPAAYCKSQRAAIHCPPTDSYGSFTFFLRHFHPLIPDKPPLIRHELNQFMVAPQAFTACIQTDFDYLPLNAVD